MVWQGNYEHFFIGGEWVNPASDRTFDVVSPSTEQVVATVPEGVTADVDRAVDAARRAFDTGPWPRMSLAERCSVLSRVAELLGEHQSDIAELVTTEMGCPITLSTGMQAVGARLLLESFVETAPQVQWETTRSSLTGKALVTRAPVGVVGAIVPWNAPLLTSVLKLAPALLTGCTVVLKPSPETPLSAYLLADVFDRAGLPAGVLNIVAADRDAGEHLVRHPGVEKISFTGSTAAGRRVGEICGHDIRRVTLELGGKSAAVVLDDADLDAVIPAVRALSLRNTGQVCSNKTRIVVARSLRDELHERLVDLVESMPVGDPFDATTELGPLVSATQRDRVEGYVCRAVDSGARLLTGGGRPDLERGYYVQPAVFGDVDRGSAIAQEEVFGPVLTVLTAENDDDAIAIANDSPYGLNGSVFSADDERALAVAHRILTGTVEINGKGAGFSSPMGGFKHSGIGREGGIEGFDTYVEFKAYGLTDALHEELS